MARKVAKTPAGRSAVFLVACFVAAGTGIVLASQKSDKDGKESENKRPKVTLRAQPTVGVAPVRVVFTAELTGGADDFEDFYCPSVEWAWGDDTSSEATLDCDPYEAGKSQIKRRFTVEHTFRRDGMYKVYFHMKRKDRFLGSAAIVVQVQPGARGPSY